MEPNPYEAPRHAGTALSLGEWLRYWVPRIAITLAVAGVVALGSGIAFVLYQYVEFRRTF